MRVRDVFDTLELPTMSVGDDLLVGKYKNSKAKIKGFDKDENNQPVLKTDKGDQKLFKPRIVKLMPVREAQRLPRGFRVFRMPRGTKVYHGTGATFAPAHLESPCWVSTSFEVAQHFMKWHDWRAPEDEDDPEHIGYRIIEYQTRKMLRLLYVEGRHTFDDIEERFGYDMQDPHEMAEVACRLGFDGWYIEDNYREGDDTMLCDSNNLTFVRLHR